VKSSTTQTDTSQEQFRGVADSKVEVSHLGYDHVDVLKVKRRELVLSHVGKHQFEHNDVEGHLGEEVVDRRLLSEGRQIQSHELDCLDDGKGH
jgi:uncharacterized membrane protein